MHIDFVIVTKNVNIQHVTLEVTSLWPCSFCSLYHVYEFVATHFLHMISVILGTVIKDKTVNVNSKDNYRLISFVSITI